jgi:hypothetical protein
VLLSGSLLWRWRGYGFGETLHRWIATQIIHPQEFPEVLSLTGGVVSFLLPINSQDATKGDCQW